jgi:hypothetical protein
MTGTNRWDRGQAKSQATPANLPLSQFTGVTCGAGATDPDAGDNTRADT